MPRSRLAASARLLALAAAAGCATVPVSRSADSPIETLVDAERAFAAEAASDGVRDAFLHHAAPDGVIFRPAPVNARDFWGPRPPAAFHLTWYPSYAEVSVSGDLGFTTGPFEVRDSAAGAPTGHGWYVTVWRNDGGGWRFVADMGTHNPPPGMPPFPWPRLPPSYIPPVVPRPASGVLDALRAADRAFNEAAAERGFAATLEERGTQEARLHRAGAHPAVGRQAAVELARRDARHYSASPREAHVSASGDFGYTVGEYYLEDASGNGRDETGWYLRIWRGGGGEPWRVVLDVTSPRPPEREE
jgi:ketosteroid isomerase-like protein